MEWLDAEITRAVIGAFYDVYNVLKSGLALPPTARLQTLNHLRATELEVGLLLHFGPEATFYRVVHSKGGR